MDFIALAERLGLEEDEFSELINLFLDVSYSNLSQLETALRKGDSRMAAHASHSIKGAACNLGLMEIAEKAEGIEMKARENHLDGVSVMVGGLREEMDRIAKSLAKQEVKR